MTHEIRFTALAKADLIALHEWIELAAGVDIADAYLGRLEAHCYALADYPLRGTPRDALQRGIRSVVFERRLVIFYLVENKAVVIQRVLSGARQFDDLFE